MKPQKRKAKLRKMDVTQKGKIQVNSDRTERQLVSLSVHQCPQMQKEKNNGKQVILIVAGKKE